MNKVWTLNKIMSGGDSVEVESLSVTENGTYTAESGKAYSPVSVNVPNPSTGSLSITQNGTYDVTEKASAVVNVGDAEDYTIKMIDSKTLEYHGKTIGYSFFRSANTTSYTTSYGRMFAFLENITMAPGRPSHTDLTIGQYAFSGLSGLITVNIKLPIKKIDYYSFHNCAKLEKIYFNGGKTSDLTMNSHSFYSCNALSDIYVPWSENEVANAPWGATNATIHYNYVPTE